MNSLGFSMSVAQKSLARGRIFDESMNPMSNNDIIQTQHIYMAMFEGQTRGLKPMFTHDLFALFDKPTGIMVHPISRNTPYSLLDEVRFHFGNDANLVHRIDQETSGLVLVARNRIIEADLKAMFEQKHYEKKYRAIVSGKIEKKLTIDTPIGRENGMIGVKMAIRDDGKASLTYINPIAYDTVTNTTFIEAIPVTGRQHQIRIHLHSLGHTIIGDPIYGVDDEIADRYLCKELSNEERLHYTKENRLMLHAHYLGFEFQNQKYAFYSKQNFPK